MRKNICETHPDAIKFWHPDKNLIPLEKVYIYSHAKFWWRCPDFHEHEWFAHASIHKDGSSCPICNKNSISKYSEILKFWHPFKNIKSPDLVSRNSNEPCWWQCPENNHEWQAAPHNMRGEKIICFQCKNLKYKEEKGKSFGIVYPNLLQFWDYETNILKPNEITYGSMQIMNWKCPNNHKWQRSVRNMCLYFNGCILCREENNNFENIHPQLLHEWDYNKNIKQPNQVFVTSEEIIFWKCKLDHYWEQKAVLSHRRVENSDIKNSTCPICTKWNIKSKRSCAETHPYLLKEWHPDNQITLYDITYGSTQKIKWKCLNNQKHYYMATCNARTGSNNSCPFCYGRVSKGETELFDILKIPYDWRNKRTIVGDRVFFPDAKFDSYKIIIEYNGDKIHGNPEYCDPNEKAYFCNQTYGELYAATLDKKSHLEAHGWTVFTIWESEWNAIKKYCFENEVFSII